MVDQSYGPLMKFIKVYSYFVAILGQNIYGTSKNNYIVRELNYYNVVFISVSYSLYINLSI